jgi:hypothetical protein
VLSFHFRGVYHVSLNLDGMKKSFLWNGRGECVNREDFADEKTKDEISKNFLPRPACSSTHMFVRQSYDFVGMEGASFLSDWKRIAFFTCRKQI